MGSAAAGVEQQGQAGGPTQTTSENKKMKCCAKNVCWTVLVTLLLAWSAGVARGEEGEGGDQGTQGDEGGADTILCYGCNYWNDETCNDQELGDTMKCPGGCLIVQGPDGNAQRGCGSDLTPHCEHGSEYSECQCNRDLCNENLHTAGADTVLCYHIEGRNADLVHAPTMECLKDWGCFIGAGGPFGDRNCGDVGSTPHCKTEGGNQGPSSHYCWCDTPLCNENFDTAGDY